MKTRDLAQLLSVSPVRYSRGYQDTQKKILSSLYLELLVSD